MRFDVRGDVEGLKHYLSDTQRRKLPQITVRALNRTAEQVRTHAVKELKGRASDEAGLGVSGFRRAIAIRRATRVSLTATLSASGKAIPLILFGARQTASGVSASPWGRRRGYKGAFITTMPSGHRGVFRRASKARLPIRELYGASLPREFIKRDIVNAMQSVAAQLWDKNFRQAAASVASR